MSAPDRPTFVNRNAMRASSEAIRKSEASAITAPAPATSPLSDAMTGLRSRRILRTRSQVIRVNSSSPPALRERRGPMISFTSPPEQKARPVPVSTATWTVSRLWRSAKRSTSPR